MYNKIYILFRRQNYYIELLTTENVTSYFMSKNDKTFQYYQNHFNILFFKYLKSFILLIYKIYPFNMIDTYLLV